MEEQELPPIQITSDDIKEANQLSLHCPICAGPVENHVRETELTPIVCTSCSTLYHQACWEQNGGKCAVLGCGSTEYRIYGRNLRPALTISKSDIREQSANGSTPGPRTKQLKDEQRQQVEALRRPGLLRRLFKWLLDQIQIG